MFDVRPLMLSLGRLAADSAMLFGCSDSEIGSSIQSFVVQVCAGSAIHNDQRLGRRLLVMHKEEIVMRVVVPCTDRLERSAFSVVAVDLVAEAYECLHTFR